MAKEVWKAADREFLRGSGSGVESKIEESHPRGVEVLTCLMGQLELF